MNLIKKILLPFVLLAVVIFGGSPALANCYSDGGNVVCRTNGQSYDTYSSWQLVAATPITVLGLFGVATQCSYSRTRYTHVPTRYDRYAHSGGPLISSYTVWAVFTSTEVKSHTSFTNQCS
jgi:hypothetical protein